MSRPVEPDAGNAGGRATRLRLLLTAERMFAEHGIGEVSARDVLAAAGQRNKNSIVYHFGGKDGLVTAIVTVRSRALDTRRAQLLAGIIDHGQDGDVAALVRALVVPLAELLEDPDNHFLGFLARYHLSRPRRELMADMEPSVTASYQQVGKLLLRATGLSRRDFRIRFGLALDLLFTALAGRQWEESHAVDGMPARTEFVDNLLSAIVGVLTAPDTA